VAEALLLSLQAIQHRGQDAAGIATWDDGRIHLRRGLGHIAQAIPDISALTGNAGIAHVRYPTAGTRASVEDAQPFCTRRPAMVLAHNGNLTNEQGLRAELREQGLTVLSECDAEPIMLALAEELTRIRPAGHSEADVAQALTQLLKRVEGGYSVVSLLEVDGRPTLLAFRDRHGIRPGVYGQSADGAWVVASESVALDVLGIAKMGDLPVGGALLLRAGEPPISLRLAEPQPRPCVFERIYFARPDSLMEDGRVNRARWRMGRQLAREWRTRGLQADVVVAVPDTSRPAAMAMAEELEIRNREGFIKNRYSGRTFIMPDQASRDAALRLKLNPIAEIFEGYRVLLVDDSIVRGSTMGRIVRLVRSLNPAEIHLAIFAPPVKNPCYYGIDMPSRDELIAAHTPVDELAAFFGADSLTYLSVEGLESVNGRETCSACFTGDYPVHVSTAEREAIERQRRGC
jgi:amidophosphoribosyltransferase